MLQRAMYAPGQGCVPHSIVQVIRGCLLNACQGTILTEYGGSQRQQQHKLGGKGGSPLEGPDAPELLSMLPPEFAPLEEKEAVPAEAAQSMP